MVDLGKLAKQAQDALAQGADKLEAAVKDNAGRIEGAVDKAGQFAKDKMPDRAAQIDSATRRAKGAVPRHEDDTSAVPDIPLATDTPTAAAAPAQTPAAPDTGAPSSAQPGSTPTAPSATPEVDRAAEQATPSSSGYAPPSPTPEVDRAARDQG